ncbi:hypothetical protein ERO13_D07G146200v2 [Gossypium hirsutum]|uniref:Nuclear transport factor 2-like n=5 Tax=Gossypium TaxID=3633 RepID=A0A1U8P5L2_GOSHI|nr:uncharacterized protein LOC107954524 [Gossypium hirsutum]KAB2021685.1 hypothetical protein ES319_D07G157200v1 [Gossypium barbadense]TYG61665.1 hypothetical protein ES288_D07G167400v1 [Gossypium darwinii]TYH63075.1 hypothetical protein ES332_D07G165400v1 [Gossypium tomentosum]TYI73887.1 hypothetical protein E1A91_D07G161200v1 [Gossypium mustelinum]KAG4138633.1 hypothetical protein ERO13_D07G146200v2 [Gossypium hirsutum]
MAVIPSFASTVPHVKSQHQCILLRQNYGRNVYTIRCNGKNSKSNLPTTTQESAPENVLLKVAWYGSELLGIAASYLRSPSKVEEAAQKDLKLGLDGSGAIDRTAVIQTIKDDFERSYFVTGQLTLDAYEEDCEFADPAGSFKGLRRFKRNCTNFGSLIEKSNMKLMKWEDLENKGVGHWRFSCVMSFPWRPILSATGYTEYFFDARSGKVCRHVEHWNVPKMALLKQLLKPTRGFWLKRKNS